MSENNENNENNHKKDNFPSFIKPSKKSCPTRYLFVSKANTTDPNLATLLTETFSQFGDLDTSLGPTCINLKRHVCYVIFKDVESCERALLATQTDGGIALQGYEDVRLICKYAGIEKPVIPPPEPECISSTANVNVPGLTVIENFVTEDEEQYLLDFCDTRNAVKYFSKDGKKERKKKGGYWENTISRRVQHFGYRFNYETRNLDAPRNMCPVPDFIIDLIRNKLNERNCDFDIKTGVAEKTEAEREEKCKIKSNDTSVDERTPPMTEAILSQMTINEYYPGQGISSHIGCGLTMTMTDSNGVQIPDDSKDFENNPIRKHVWLPARSLLVLEGDARYRWAHGIAPRTMDKVNGTLLRRKRRVSFTIREGIYTLTEEDLQYEELQKRLAELSQDTTSAKPSLKLSEKEEAAIINSLHQEKERRHEPTLVSSKVEEEHVFRVYDEIAEHWHHTRGKRKVYWHIVRNFLENLPAGCLVADVGCGDGKYFGVGEDIISIGCDRSRNLLQVSRDPRNSTFCCDAVSLPFVSDMFDAAICIAVLHHLASVERRLAVISEIVRILRPGGQALIQAWALEQEATSKRQFKRQDVLVPWALQQPYAGNNADQNQGSKSVVFQRFCHVYKKGELEELIERIPRCGVVESGYDKSNWFIIIEKKN